MHCINICNLFVLHKKDHYGYKRWVATQMLHSRFLP